MNIIKTDIVVPATDVLWDDVDTLTADAAPSPVLVLVKDFEDKTSESVQLQKMLDACKLHPTQYNVIRLKGEQMAAWPKLREKLDPRVIFLIGVLPSQLGISALLSLNFPNNFDGRVWLPTVSLAELAKNDDMKKQLWTNGMKPVFVDKNYGEI